MPRRIRIAVASRNGKSVAGHIGKCRDWLVFEVCQDAETTAPVVHEQERVSLPKEMVFHHYKDDQPHSLSTCSVVIGASAGESFVSRMAQRGMDAVLTAETAPDRGAFLQAARRHVFCKMTRACRDSVLCAE